MGVWRVSPGPAPACRFEILMTNSSKPAGDADTLGVGSRQPAVAGSSQLDTGAILAAVGEAAFEWDLSSDAMIWQSNAGSVLGVTDMGAIARGSAFQLLVASEHAASRYRCIWEQREVDKGEGVAYQAQFRFHPQGRRSEVQSWLEERGRWYAGSAGKPQRVVGVLRAIDSQREEIDRLRRLSEHDELTGLLNRRMLLQTLDRAAAAALQDGRPSVFMIAAINNLAVINQTFGFDVGDAVIANVADRLRRQMRGGDCIGRFSTNKIGLVIHDCEADGLQAVARRLMAVVRDSTIRCATSEIVTTISLGAVQMPSHAGNSPAAVAAALEALGDARQVRQDRLVCYSPARTASQGRKRSIETAASVLSALEEQRMRVALQGVVHAGTREVAFYECLLRILAKDGTLTPAAEFVPIAEQLGLAGMIDRRVLEMAVGMVRADPLIRISFNVSSLTSGDHEWLVLLHKLTSGDRKITGRLLIEITETMAIDDLDETAAFVDGLKEIGCTVALDDFGAGYTSFRNLKSLAVDIVKLDGSFVRNLKDDKANRIFVQSMVALARNFGMATVAEMVGDAETADILTESGVDFLQGYYFGQPQVAPLPLPIAPKV